MMYLLVVLCSMALLIFAQCMVEKKNIEIVLAGVLSVVYYFCIYVAVSGVLFVLGIFSLGRSTAGVFLITCVISAVLIYKRGIKSVGDIQVEWDAGASVWSYLVIAVIALFTMGHFEFFGMGQDQGVYQTEAINLYYNITDKQQNIPEYDELEKGEYKTFYQQSIRSLGGFDLLVDSTMIPGCEIDGQTSDTEGMWHGIPTFASILGLSAKIFGIENMSYIQGIFFVCMLLLLEFTMKELQVGAYLRVLCLTILGISPQIIWVKKSTLTEIFLALLIMAFLYFILHKKKEKKLLAVIPIITFCFFHVTIFTVMPIFVFVFWYLFATTGQKEYLRSVKVIIVGYLLGFLMMCYSQPRYTLLNYQHGMPFVPLNLIPVLVVCACIGAYLMTALIGKKVKKTIDGQGFITSYLKCLSIVPILLIAIRILISNYTYHQLTMITIVCYGILAGVFLLPVILYLLFSKKYDFDETIGILGLLFAWCILIYSFVMRRDIQYYYYYGRYLAPYISIIVLFFAYLVKNKNWKMQFLPSIMGVVILLPFASVLYLNQDDSRMEWETLGEVMETADDAQVILLDSDLMQLFYFPLKAVSGAKVYPVMNELDTTLQSIPSSEGRTLYLSKNTAKDNDSWMRILYRNETYSEEDGLNHVSHLLGLVTDIAVESQYGITVYEMERESQMISAASMNAFCEGWTYADGNGFRWMTGRKSSLQCYLAKDDYTMTVQNGNRIPFGNILEDNITLQVYLNGTYIQTLNYNAQNEGEKKMIVLPKESVIERSNIITFEYDTWSPAEYGSADKSNYGISISGIEFVRGENQT